MWTYKAYFFILQLHMKKCYIYCRKSSEDRNKQIQSNEDQERVLRELALNKNLKVEKIFIDVKSAGKPFQREGYTQMMNIIKKGKIKTVLVWKIDRLSRNSIDNGEISWMLQNSLIEAIITPDRVFRPEDNVLLFYVEGAMANQYLRDLSKNVKRGMKSKIEKGIYPAFAPVGYLNSGFHKGQKTIEVDPIMFPRLKALWNYLITEKCQLSELYKLMKSQYPIIGKQGQPVAFSTFHRIFQNPFYCGIFRWGGKLHVGIHKRMITKTQFDRIQEILKRKPKTRVVDHEFMYRGIFSCGCCGSAITAERKKKFIKTKGITRGFVYYKCPHHKKNIVCSELPISRKGIDQQLHKWIKKIHLPTEVIQYGIKVLGKESDELINLKEQIGSFDRQLLELDKKIQKVSDNFVMESDSEFRELMKDKVLELKMKRLELMEGKQSLIGTEKNFRIKIQSQLMVMKSSKEILKTGLWEDRKRLMNAIGENWTVKNKKLSCEPFILAQVILKYNRNREKFGLKNPCHHADDEDFCSIACVWRGIWELIRNSIE